MTLLHTGDRFPSIAVSPPGGETLDLPPVSVHSGGAIGRLMPDDVVGPVRHLREHAAPA